MPATSIEGIVCSVSPFRESSVILKLFTRSHGLIGVIAKGLRNSKKGSIAIERGYIIEGVVYVKPSASLYVIGSIHIKEFFPEIRTHLVGSALRDSILELLIRSTQESHPQSNVYTLTENLFVNLSVDSKTDASLFHRACSFLLEWMSIHGFDLNTQFCLTNHTIDLRTTGGTLDFQRGGFNSFLGANEFWFPPGFFGGEHLETNEIFNCFKSLLNYCRYHSDIRAPIKSLAFLESIL